ncbi:PilZ domain-containing protein [Nocardioides aquiterrae]
MSDQRIAAPNGSHESVLDTAGDAVLDLSLRERLRWAFAVVLRGNGAPGPYVPHGPHGPHRPQGITHGTHEVEVVPVAAPRPRPSAGALVAVAAVTGVVVLICYVAWAVLAGERLVVGNESGDPGRDARRELVRDLRAPEPTDDPSRDLSTTTAAPAQASRHAAPVPGTRSTTIDGSLAALAVAVGAIAAGLAVARAILRRSRGSDDERDDELELVETGDGDETDSEAEADAASEHHVDQDDGDVGSPDDDTEQDTDAGPVVPSPRSGGHDAATCTGPDAGATAATAVGPAQPRVVLYDRRMTRRVEVRIPARLQWPGHDTACAAESLSIWGLRCLVPTSDPDQVPGVGSSVRITIAVGGALLPLEAGVTYARSRQDGHVVGLRFHPLDEVHRDFLFAVIDDADADGAP